MVDISEAVFGLIGVVVGGIITTAGTIWAQRSQLRGMVASELRAREISASSAALDAASHLLQLPDKPERTGSDHVAQAEWDRSRQEFLRQLAIAAQDLRHAALRARIDQTQKILMHHAAAWNLTAQPEHRSRTIACTHALESIGAFRRGEPLPPAPRSFTDTIEAITQWESREQAVSHSPQAPGKGSTLLS